MHGLLATVFEECLRLLFKLYFGLVHRARVSGLERVPREAARLVVIANHASLIDGLFVWTYLKLPLRIVVDRTAAARRLFRPFAHNIHTIEIDSANPYALKDVARLVAEGAPLLIFPEGRRTSTGSLMKIYDGTGFVALHADAAILPLHLDTYRTLYARKHPGRRFFAPIAMTVGKTQLHLSLDHLPRSKRKQAATRAVYRMLSEVYLEAHGGPSTLGREFIGACREHRGRPLFDDATGVRMTYGKALAAAFTLGRLLTRGARNEKNDDIAVMLPNLTVTALVFMGLQLFRKTAVFLNYSAGRAAIGDALSLADPAVVVASRVLLERMRLDEDLFGDRRVVFVEDFKNLIRARDKAWGLIRSFFSGKYAAMSPGEEGATAVVFFTSGSEGAPKGVCLSHENLMTNVHQALSRIGVSGEDHFFNALPLFHAFGLTVGTIIPVMIGARAFFYANPLHYRAVPEMAYEKECTVLCGTPTFLRGYGRRANPYDFSFMRHVFSGAERLSDALFDDYAKKFGIRVLEGYGVTECSPMISINSPLDHEYGTVGMALPGIECRLEGVPGIDAKGGRVGRLLVRGGNVMKGYLRDEKANYKYLVEDRGWHDTGDIVETTAEGFLKIVGRVRRFAKVGGEMVSLAAVEDALEGALGGRGKSIAVIAAAEERTGERLAVVTDSAGIDAKVVRQALLALGFSDRAIPREVRLVKRVPKLGTGKIDYMALGAMMEAQRETGEKSPAIV
jgi:acyl-[acyl-carrier-protein]-phospholipid O-acyltransferase/long-chain-fatty-acid--[acyl-carrier-protein] ligase